MASNQGPEVLLLREHSRPPPGTSRTGENDVGRFADGAETMTKGIDLHGPDIFSAVTHQLENIKAYRDGRIAGFRHAQRGTGARALGTSPPLVGSLADWQTEGPDWFLRGFCDGLVLHAVSC
jgi:hypothetical protein